MSYKVIPIPQYITDQVRKTLVSPQYRHPAAVMITHGYGPCRSCLRTFVGGRDERILFNYNSFEGLSNLPLPGPIFIHKDDCTPFDSADVFPQDLKELPLLFEAFGENSELFRRVPVDKERVGRQIAELLDLPGVRFLNIRNAEAGCFVARVES